MLVPALIFHALNPAGEAARAGHSDGHRYRLCRRCAGAARQPRAEALITFLVALAIVDDLGAVLVIALFYTMPWCWRPWPAPR